MFKYLQQTWTNIFNFWYRQSPINLILLTLTTLQYVVEQRTSLGFPLATWHIIIIVIIIVIIQLD